MWWLVIAVVVAGVIGLAAVIMAAQHRDLVRQNRSIAALEERCRTLARSKLTQANAHRQRYADQRRRYETLLAEAEAQHVQEVKLLRVPTLINPSLFEAGQRRGAAVMADKILANIKTFRVIKNSAREALVEVTKELQHISSTYWANELIELGRTNPSEPSRSVKA